MIENNKFEYNYSAKEQDEIKKIREKYTETNKEESKIERLRRLDASVESKARTVSLIIGVLGTLILGSGMSLCMTDIGASLGLDGSNSMIIGIVVGVIGGITAALAYPSYEIVVKNKRKKIAPEILLLTDELMK